MNENNQEEFWISTRIPPRYARVVDTRGEYEWHEEDDETTAARRAKDKAESERKIRSFKIIVLFLFAAPMTLCLTGMWDASIAAAMLPSLVALALPTFNELF